jgi:hypothetical protein
MTTEIYVGKYIEKGTTSVYKEIERGEEWEEKKFLLCVLLTGKWTCKARRIEENRRNSLQTPTTPS